MAQRHVHHRPELLAQLADGVHRLTGTEEWRRHLEFQSRFHRYSFGNVVLIATQRPTATQVAGFGTWKKLGRTVCRGERAIFILAPVRYGPRPEVVPAAAPPAAAPASGAPASDNDESGPGTPPRAIRGFRWVPVFDVAQTEGEEPPSPCHRLAGEDPGGLFGQLAAAAAGIGFRVEDASLGGATNGDCSFDPPLIRVESANAPAQRVKTLAHELAHALLHRHGPDRRLAELEAESTAYVVCRSLGIDSGAYSFGYVAGWAGGGDEARTAISASGERIQRAAATILTAMAERPATVAVRR